MGTERELPHFIFLHSFERLAQGLLDDEDIRLAQLELSNDPRAGAVVRGTGGLRKMRVALEGRGKSGGARLLYLYVEVRSVIYFVAAYSKTRESDLTRDDYQKFAELVKHLKKET